MDAEQFRSLPARLRALVAVAVLLDGREAEGFLAADAEYGAQLSKIAASLAAQPPELRMPFVGTMLRSALEEIEAE